MDLTAILLFDVLGKPAWLWLLFLGLVLTLLVLDLGHLLGDGFDVVAGPAGAQPGGYGQGGEGG